MIDKPPDISSAQVVGRVKSRLKAKKAGHAGTLDPFATGVLVCCINQATRLAGFFLKSEKTYRAKMVLGTATDTQDATGTVVSKGDSRGITPDDIDRVFDMFSGTIHQQPPAYSALKHRGTPLYKLARRGCPVQKPPRKVQIRRLTITDLNLPEVRFDVTCSSGTYIRTLCADIGMKLGCGAHLAALRRLRSGSFSLEQSVSLPELDALAASGKLDRRMIGMSDALQEMPGCVADRDLIDRISTGRILTPEDMACVPPDLPVGFFKVVDRQNRLVAILNRKKDLSTYDYRCVFPALRR